MFMVYLLVTNTSWRQNALSHPKKQGVVAKSSRQTMSWSLVMKAVVYSYSQVSTDSRKFCQLLTKEFAQSPGSLPSGVFDQEWFGNDNRA